MKHVFYSSKRDLANKFVLTEKEFAEARVFWSKNKHYSCDRLGVVLGPHFVYAETPPEYLDNSVYLVQWNPGEPFTRFVVTPEGKVFEIDANGGNWDQYGKTDKPNDQYRLNKVKGLLTTLEEDHYNSIGEERKLRAISLNSPYVKKLSTSK